MDTIASFTVDHLRLLPGVYVNRPDTAASVIYFGPMGCRTGFYLLMAGERTSESVVALLRDLFSHIAGYEGEIPGATPAGCGNCLDMNLPMARWHARRFLAVLDGITPERLHYPQ